MFPFQPKILHTDRIVLEEMLEWIIWPEGNSSLNYTNKSNNCLLDLKENHIDHTLAYSYTYTSLYVSDYFQIVVSKRTFLLLLLCNVFFV